MRAVATKLWVEPNYFIALLVGVLQVAQILLVDDRAASAAIAAALMAFGGVAVRSDTPPAKPLTGALEAFEPR